MFNDKNSTERYFILETGKDTLVNSSIEKDSLDVSDATSVCTILELVFIQFNQAFTHFKTSIFHLKLKLGP